MRGIKVFLVLLSIAAFSCSKMKSESEAAASARAQPAPATSAASPAAPSAAANVAEVKVLRGDGSELFSFSEQSGTVNITADGKTYRGTMRDSGKRKYELVGGAGMYEIKPGDDGFKLRRGDGKLLWKVKFKEDKIKISDNEENQNPFELKLKESDRVKVVAPGERELGKVSYDAATQTAEVKDSTGTTKFKLTGQKAMPASAGVLLLDGIPDVERYVLMAELVSRGK